MEKILILSLFGVIFVNLIVYIFLIVRIHKKIKKTRFDLTNTIDTMENNVKTSFKNAHEHSDRINQKLSENKAEFTRELENIDVLLQELKKETSDNSKEYNNAIRNIENKIESLVADYKELRWQIENLTKIEEDSKRLNEDTDETQQEALIKAIVKKIRANKEKLPLEKNASPKDIGENASNDSIATFDESNKSTEKVQNESIQKEDAFSDRKESIKQATSANYVSSPQVEPKPVFVGDGISLDIEQATALDCMENTTGNYFITGKAGTGKSFLLKIFQSLTKKTLLKVAPTGIAALNIDGVTIHSAFGYNNLSNQSVETLDKKTLSLSPNKELVLKNIDVLIIDEISMVRADIFDKIDKILRIVCQKENLPFGGKQVLVFGDLFQLPPIANKNEEKYLKDKYGGIFFFNSNSYKNSSFSFIELRTNHRQKGDQRFFEILNKIREGRITKTDIDLVNERYVENSEELRRVIKLYPKRELAIRDNEDALSKIWGDEQIYNAVITYNRYADQNYSIENNFQVSAMLKLKIGAMVMMTRNDPDRRWVNGTLGIVEKMGEDTIFVRIKGYVYEIGRAEFEMNEAVYENGSITYRPILKVSQFPMILAYAITIHKSQGSTYQQIACDPSDCFAPGQAYVALSRCVGLNGVHLLKKISSVDIKVDSQVREFYLSNS